MEAVRDVVLDEIYPTILKELKMNKQIVNIKIWKAEIAKDYHTYSAYVVPANSFAVWGYENTRRHMFKMIKSPFGGWYKIFSSETMKERKIRIEKARLDSLHFDNPDILAQAEMEL